MTGDATRDEALMQRYQGGDVSAFDELLRPHRRPVFNFLSRLVGNAAVAEELLQEVFLRVIRSAPSYEPRAKFTTWLYTIARNLAVDQARRASHRDATSLDAEREQGSLGQRVAGRDAAVDEQVIGRQVQQHIEMAIAELEPEQREVFLMREYLDLPFVQIAEVVGCPLNTAKSRMRYAIKHLRKHLRGYQDLIGKGRRSS